MEYLYPSLQKGLVGAWCPSVQRARGVSAIVDQSPSNKSATLSGMDPATDWIPSEGKYALSFNGTISRALIDDKILLPNANAASMCCWVKPGTFSASCRPISQGGNNLTIQRLSATTWRAVCAATGSGQVLSSTVSFTNGVWQHWALVWLNSVVYMYVDGVLLRQQTLGGGSATLGTAPETACIGDSSAGGQKINALIDDVSIYGRSLLPSEVKTLSLRRGIAYETRRRTRAYVAGGGPTPFPSEGSGSIAGTGSLAGVGSAVYSGSGTITATGSLDGSGTAVENGSGSITAAGTLTGTGTATQNGSGTIAATGALSGVGTAIQNGSGTITASGTLAGVGSAIYAGSGTITATGTLAGEGTTPGIVVPPDGFGSITATGTLTGVGAAVYAGLGTIVGTGSLVGTGSAAYQGSGSISGVGTLTGASPATGSIILQYYFLSTGA